MDVLDYSGKKLLSEGGIVLAAALTVTQNTSVTTVSDIVQFCRLDLKMFDLTVFPMSVFANLT